MIRHAESAVSTHQPSKESDEIVFFNLLDLYLSSPGSGDLQCKQEVSKTPGKGASPASWAWTLNDDFDLDAQARMWP